MNCFEKKEKKPQIWSAYNDRLVFCLDPNQISLRLWFDGSGFISKPMITSRPVIFLILAIDFIQSEFFIDVARLLLFVDWIAVGQIGSMSCFKYSTVMVMFDSLVSWSAKNVGKFFLFIFICYYPIAEPVSISMQALYIVRIFSIAFGSDDVAFDCKNERNNAKIFSRLRTNQSKWCIDGSGLE